MSDPVATIALDQEARPKALWLVAWQPRPGTVPPGEDPPAPGRTREGRGRPWAARRYS